MTSYVLWGILILSVILLTLVLARNPHIFQSFGYVCLHVAIGIFLLYLLNLFSPYTRLELPLNAVTVGTVSVLGIPGLMMLAALKLWIIV
ncbi:pro-sigmaK processing inhibitor BofA family protein [Paenibacillus filicis]|uniref:Pro-sigmaK processing inhibitor BofA family protein n=1 Tax=Paenibacillus gyeongsangnamensis TaxID=3388067 RepID=A0ABT4QCK7_9BACL|nr:pro-sigmaK processing inhibitor BofA family protein [Paenibacillus filicis]MCZ8514605.1 pro-sigmaK processing inhibitor BofA family protein [Paenibacillus filicis]